MPLPLYGLRRFRYGRYFGDGAYPNQPRYFVLTDRTTGQLYRVTAPSGNPSLVSLSGLSSQDERQDFLTALAVTRDFFNAHPTLTTEELAEVEADGVTWVNVYADNGTLHYEATPDRSRPPYIPEAGVIYMLVIVTDACLGV